MHHRPRARVWVFLLAAVATLLVVASSTGGRGVVYSVTPLAPPYKAAVSPYNSAYLSGCGRGGILQPWGFNLSSGAGGGDGAGKAVMCPAAQYGFGTSSSLQSYGSFQLALPFKIPLGATHIQANVSVGWSTTVRSTDGGHAACNQGSTYDDQSYTAQWGYTKSPIGNYYAGTNSSSTDRTDQTSGSVTTTSWSNSTSHATGTAPTPHPFHYNASSAFSWTHSWGGSASCSAGAGVNAYASSYLVDESNGSYIPQTVSTVGTYGAFFALSVNTYNYTSWGCYNSTNWNGLTSQWNNVSRYCGNYNGTVTSYASSNYPYYQYITSNVPSFTLTSRAVALSGYWEWTYTYNPAHHFELFVTVSASGSCYNSWPAPGFGGYSLDMAKGGYAFHLTSVVSS